MELLRIKTSHWDRVRGNQTKSSKISYSSNGTLKSNVHTVVEKQRQTERSLQILKRGTSWNHLKRDVTTWNKLEPPVTRWTLQLNDTRNKKFIGETVRAMPLPNGIPYSLAMAIAIKSTILDVYRRNHPGGNGISNQLTQKS